MNNYRELYRQSQKEKASLEKIAKDLQIQNQCLNQTNVNLYQRNALKCDMIRQLEKQLIKVSVPKMRKKIGELKSASQISNRKKIYRRCIGRSIRSLPDAVSANVSLNVGSEWINIMFSERELQQFSYENEINARNVARDHSYSNNENDDGGLDDDDSDESDSEEIILSHGKFSCHHKRNVAHVMDLHKISEKAYHELRLSCKGLLPPLSQVRRERLLMSSEIPYIVNPSVSYLNNANFINTKNQIVFYGHRSVQQLIFLYVSE